MKKSLLAAAIASIPMIALAQAPGTAKAGDVLTYGMGQGLQRFSPLTQIDKVSVKRLVPVWTYSLADQHGEEAQPLVVDGVMYMTTPDATMAVDALSGKEIWKTKIEYPQEMARLACCGIVNRGAALSNGKLFRVTLDAHVQALDAKTGRELWNTTVIDYKAGYSMTVAPLVANGVLITGISGGEYGIRGFLDGWDPETGKRLWRRYTTAGKGEPGGDTWPGDTAEHGGGSTWLTGSYDPDLDLVYWGTGNGGPWNPNARRGDNLYTCSVLAVRPKTGEIVWHYQFSPNDGFDYDGTNELVQADLDIAGAAHKVIMQANRNGFFYVIDRTNGKLLTANPYVHQNWAEKLEEDGRPVLSVSTKQARDDGKTVEIWPSPFGGKNWMPMAFNPGTGLAYANTLDIGFPYKLVDAQYRAGTWYTGVDLTGFTYPEGERPRGYLKAIDPATGKAKWQVPWAIPSFSGVVTTGGGLVFTGEMTGEFAAFDADTGAKLWQYQTGSGVISQPIVWQKDGREYVTVASGIGGVFPLFAGDERLAKIPTGGSLTTFALMQ